MGVGLTSSLFCAQSLLFHPWLMKRLKRAFMTIEFLLKDQSLGREGRSEKATPAFSVFQVLSAQDGQYITMIYFKVSCSATLHL